MQRWANRWGQRHPTAALVLSGLTFFVLAIGLVGNKPYAEIAPEWGTGPSVNEVVASYVLGMCLVLVLNRLVLRFATSGPVPMVTALDGERATLLKRGAKLFATQMAVVIGTALALGVLAWLGFRTGSVVVALLLAAGAAWSGSVVVPIVLRRYTPGGVWLTPNGFTDRHRGIEVTLAWDDVASAEFGVRDRMAVMGAPDLPVLVGTRRKRPYTVRYLAGIWKNPRRPMSKAVFLETRELAVNPGTLAHVVVHYARNRDERHELGTEESFTTLANLHDGSGDKRGFLDRKSVV